MANALLTFTKENSSFLPLTNATLEQTSGTQKGKLQGVIYVNYVMHDLLPITQAVREIERKVEL